jgi:N-acetylmuramoyl-L-alanine amidase
MPYTKEQAWELSLLALCAWREARDQGFEGMLAVCWSVRNRVTHPEWWGHSWVDVIQKKWQYSSFNPDDPNAKLLPGDPNVDASWHDALRAADLAYTGYGVDPTLGSTHYFVAAMKMPPAWATAPGTEFKIQIGAHRFYKAA